jgi:hypothetical protein
MLGFRKRIYTVRDPCTTAACPYCSGIVGTNTFSYDECPNKVQDYYYKETTIEGLGKQELNKIKTKERLNLSSKTRKSSRWA